MNKLLVPIVLSTTIALAGGLAGGYYLFGGQQMANPSGSAGASEVKAEREVLFYRNPMKPAVTSPVPAKDEMGMDYIPVYADGGAGDGPAGTVTIDPVMEQNIGVRTTVAKKQVLSRIVRAVGRVTYDEEKLYRIHPKVEGWIDELFINQTGEQVNEDTMLLSVYSPQLVATQQEYLLALKNEEILKDSPFDDIRNGAVNLVESSRKRLELLDVPAHQLKDLTNNKVVKKSLHIHSPYRGVVMNLGVSKGEFVTPRTELYMLADLSNVWVFVDVYEYELPWVKKGDIAEMTTAAVPGKTFTGKVTFIYPYMEKKTRTARVRLEFDNKDGQLKPDMFTNVVLKGGKKINAVVVPSEALVRSGSRTQVFVQRAKGKFEPREVTVGISTAGLTQILSGVEEGEEVITSSQFLIDSESKLREATAKMLEQRAAEAAPEDMDDMDMDDLSFDDVDDGTEVSK
jgi:Cu(I)/Ag(I) efflux system membrane fusion protein